MNRRLLAILLAAFLIASVCTFLVYQMVNSRMAAVRPSVATGIVAAKTDIKLGTVLSANDLTTVQIAGGLPSGAILVKDMSRAIGRGVISDLYAGEPIIENRLAAIGSGGGLAATIPPGMRACAVRVDDVVNVSGFVTPGMHVDVLISGTPPGTPNTAQGQISKTLLQNIQVLSAGTEIQKDPEGKAKPVQVLRNPLDTKVGVVAGTDTSSLFSGAITAPPKPQRVAAPKSAEPPAYSIEVINGSTTSQEKFASPEGHK
jgi:pilus assembly protein CpaB